VSTIYLIGSLRNPKIPQVANILRSAGHDVFDDWYSPGPKCDEEWKNYEQCRGRTYKEALRGYHAEHQFDFDLHHLRRVEIGVLVAPAGRSAHMELGYMIGRGQRGYILMEGEPDPDRWDLMYKFAHGIALDIEELQEMVR
jgi:hypothetical protein